ncbi:Protein YceI [Kordia antarctica]|uniref:Protein YceI n=1 Tax=Kordia antarctica TaxID=1218801 RepID=A0A7L4ZFD9_9FLAO|nr:YceI family protein [Kordia antarctica]QHI34916.1 Protein YceI [Kordia antarctica]
MNKFKYIVLSFVALGIIVVSSSYTNNTVTNEKNEDVKVLENKENQTINLFVTHGHCSTPFSGVVNDLKVTYSKRNDLGNPLENMKISFDVDPNSFNVCANDDLTAKIKTPDLFISMNNEKITFRSTDVYTMGLDWYQVNGKLSIKGIEKDVKFFVTGIRDPKEAMASSLVLEGQMNLFDWGIDYDKIVNGTSDNVPTKLMHMNMKITMP